MNKVFSTSAIAQLLGVAPGSVVNWIDQNQLKAGRTPGGHRRVVLEDLLEFLRQQNLPVPSELLARTPRVLVVDDEPTVAQLIAAQICEAYPDVQILMANDGFSAGQIVGSLQPDVVILDLRMPGMDGYEVCRQIKGNPQTRQTAVIAVTAFFSAEATQKILGCEAQACLPKPLETAALLEEVEQALCTCGVLPGVQGRANRRAGDR